MWRALLVGMVGVAFAGCTAANPPSLITPFADPSPTSGSTPSAATPLSNPSPTATKPAPAVVSPRVAETTPVPTRTPEPAFEAVTLSGTGDVLTKAFTLPPGVILVEATHSGSSSFIIWMKSTTRNTVDLLVNTAGAYHGTNVVGVKREVFAGITPGTYALDITAEGAWAVTISKVAPTTKAQFGKGTGDGYVGVIDLGAGLRRFTMTHAGTGNFIVWLYKIDGLRVELLVSTIAKYSGSKGVQIQAGSLFGATPGQYVVGIHADGIWTLEVD